MVRPTLTFSGHAQKEFFVNQSVALTDSMLYAAVEGVINSPPAQSTVGEC